MASSPETKALEAIAKELNQMNRLLARIEQNTRPRKLQFGANAEVHHHEPQPRRDDDYGQGAMDATD